MATLATIRDLARIYADQDSSDFPTDAQYNSLINAAAQRVWYDLLMAGWPADFTALTVTATGVTTYSLGTGIAAVRGVYRSDSNGLYRLNRVNEGKRAELLSLTGLAGFAEFYDIRTASSGGTGMVLELLPRPTGGTYRVDVINEFPGFSVDGSVWPGPAGSDELIALKAAELAVKKESRREDAQDLRADYRETLDDVIKRANWLNLLDPPQIRDVMSGRSRHNYDYPVAGPGYDF